MANKPMTPAGGNGSHKPAKVTTGKNRPTMGTSAFHLVDDASAKDVRAGYLAARPEGRGVDQSIFGEIGHRRGVEVGGPTFGIRARRTAQSETYSGTLAAGRLMRPAMQPVESFLGSARRFGVTGPK